MVDDGTIIVYSLHGQYQKSITMGEEVRQTRVKQARGIRDGQLFLLLYLSSIIFSGLQNTLKDVPLQNLWWSNIAQDRQV